MSGFIPLTPAYVLLGVILSWILAVWIRHERGLGIPPGPKPLPLLGNLHQLPATDQHLTLLRWASRYGDIVYVRFLRQPVVILNSAEAAFDLLEKRGAKYSGRPRLAFFNELLEWKALGWRDYGESWRRNRKWFQSALLARASLDGYLPLQRREAQKVLQALVQDPEDFFTPLRRFSAAMMTGIGYGHTITSLDDKHVRAVENAMAQTLRGSSVGGALVDLIPSLMHIPAWIPGAGFKRAAAGTRALIRAMEDVPHDRVKAEVAAGTARPSFTKALIDECAREGQLTAEDEREVKSAAGTLYAAGTDTTSAALSGFILAMTLNPEVIKKAQEDIDCLVGDVRLPDLADRASLPYIDCIIKEVYRTYPIIPLGIPHRSTEADIYRGYYIPQGATVIANIAAMCRDPAMYPDPDVFRPERFLDTGDAAVDHMDPRKLIFGFGRRICPGRLLADANVWLVTACILATLDIRKARDAQGEEITPTTVFLSGTVHQPAPFMCDIRPRSERARELILSSGMDIWTGC